MIKLKSWLLALVLTTTTLTIHLEASQNARFNPNNHSHLLGSGYETNHRVVSIDNASSVHRYRSHIKLDDGSEWLLRYVTPQEFADSNQWVASPSYSDLNSGLGAKFDVDMVMTDLRSGFQLGSSGIEAVLYKIGDQLRITDAHNLNGTRWFIAVTLNDGSKWKCSVGAPALGDYLVTRIVGQPALVMKDVRETAVNACHPNGYQPFIIVVGGDLNTELEAVVLGDAD